MELTAEGLKEWQELFKLSAPVSVELLNSAPCFHDNPAIQALALMGDSVALSKDSGLVTREEFLTGCALMWDSQEASYDVVEERLN